MSEENPFTFIDKLCELIFLQYKITDEYEVTQFIDELTECMYGSLDPDYVPSDESIGSDEDEKIKIKEKVKVIKDADGFCSLA